MIVSKKDKKNFEYKIEKVLGTISESKSSNWGKFVIRVRINDSPYTIDIRNLKINDDGTFTIGKGVALSNKDTDRLVELLVQLGYGDTDKLSSLIDRREEYYGRKSNKVKISIGGKKLWLSD